jgi:DNA polymerase V
LAKVKSKHDTTLDPLLLEDLMQHTPVKEVWGIGYQLVKQLGSYEIYSCLDLTFAMSII